MFFFLFILYKAQPNHKYKKNNKNKNKYTKYLKHLNKY